MSVQRRSWLSRATAGISILGVIAVNFSGFVDHATHSGQGCGAQWPLCQGAWFPLLTNHAVALEYTHRVLTLVFLLALIGLGLVIWREPSEHRHTRQKFVVFALLLFGEIALCTASVLGAPPPWLLAALAPIGLATQVLLMQLALPILVARRMPTRVENRGRSWQWACGAAWGSFVYGTAWHSYAPHSGAALALSVTSALLVLVVTVRRVWRDRPSAVRGWELWPLALAPFMVGWPLRTLGFDLVWFAWLSWGSLVAWTVAHPIPRGAATLT